jgi:hypothetical protein
LKLVQQRAGNLLETIGIGKDFLSRTQAVQHIRERMDRWDYMKLKDFCAIKKWSLNQSVSPRMRENLCFFFLFDSF